MFIGNRDLKWNISVCKVTVIQHVKTSFLDTLKIISYNTINASSKVTKNYF